LCHGVLGERRAVLGATGAACAMFLAAAVLLCAGCAVSIHDMAANGDLDAVAARVELLPKGRAENRLRHETIIAP